MNIPVKNEGKLKGFPKIKLDISYRVSARVGDLVEITMSPTYAGRTSVVWFFKITRGEHLLADGSMTVVYATIDLISGKIVREPVPSLWAKFLKEREE